MFEILLLNNWHHMSIYTFIYPLAQRLIGASKVSRTVVAFGPSLLSPTAFIGLHGALRVGKHEIDFTNFHQFPLRENVDTNVFSFMV